ncbi:MAG: hypothetical protein ACE5GT_13200 [Rhodospirillales bacterium]
MSVAEGLALAFLKVGVLAVAIFAVVGVICKAAVALHRRTEDTTDTDAAD